MISLSRTSLVLLLFCILPGAINGRLQRQNGEAGTASESVQSENIENDDIEKNEKDRSLLRIKPTFIAPGTQVTLQTTIKDVVETNKDFEMFIAYDPSANDRVGLGSAALPTNDWFRPENAVFTIETCNKDIPLQRDSTTTTTTTTARTTGRSSRVGSSAAKSCSMMEQCVSIKAHIPTTVNLYGSVSLQVEPQQFYVRYKDDGTVWLAERLYSTFLQNQQDPDLDEQSSFCMTIDQDTSKYRFEAADRTFQNHFLTVSDLAKGRFYLNLVEKTNSDPIDDTLFANYLDVPYDEPFVFRTMEGGSNTVAKWIRHNKQDDTACADPAPESWLHLGSSMFLAKPCLINAKNKATNECDAGTQCVAFQSLLKPSYYWVQRDGSVVIKGFKHDSDDQYIADASWCVKHVKDTTRESTFLTIASPDNSVHLDQSLLRVGKETTNFDRIAAPLEGTYDPFLPPKSKTKFELFKGKAHPQEVMKVGGEEISSFVTEECMAGRGSCTMGIQCVSFRSSTSQDKYLHFDVKSGTVGIVAKDPDDQTLDYYLETSWCLYAGLSGDTTTVSLNPLVKADAYLRQSNGKLLVSAYNAKDDVFNAETSWTPSIDKTYCLTGHDCQNGRCVMEAGGSTPINFCTTEPKQSD